VSSSSDPLLKALQSGDRNCPDGASLTRLGALVRAASASAPADLRDRVRHAIARDVAEDLDLDAAVDRWVEGAPDVQLERLRGLTHGQPRPADLRDRVRRAIAPASLRLSPQQAERTGRRWRLIAAIAAAHVAAVLVFTSLADDTPGGTAISSTAATTRSPDATVRAPDWEHLRRNGGDVLAPRRSNLARETARADAGLGDTAAPVGRMLAWLIARQDSVSGRIANAPGVSADRATASQALAALALLGEGAGDQTRLSRARLALGPVASAMAGAEPLSPAALSACALALVEGALVTHDPELHLTAKAALLRLTREMPGSPHEGGLAGLAWLALETAETGRLEPPRGAVEAARNRIARPLPPGEADAGRLGLAAYARIVFGLGAQDGTRAQLAALAANPPATDREGRTDPLGWFLAGLAVHAGGGPDWTAWAKGLRTSLVPRLVADGPALAHMPADAVRHAAGDEVLATALTVLALQAPYRYAVPAAE
jgi:hypothetical protein